MDLFEEQLKLESGAVEEAKTAYENALIEKKAKGDLSGLRPEQRLLEAAIEPLVEALKRYLGKENHGKAYWIYAFIKGSNLFETAFIAAKTVMTAFYTKESIQQTANTLGGALILQRDYNRLKKHHPVLVKILNENLKYSTTAHKLRVWRNNYNSRFTPEEFTPHQRVALGMTVLNLIVHSSGVIQLGKIPSKRGSPLTSLEPTPEAQAWLNSGHSKCQLLYPTMPPMVVPPMDWSSNTDGGYLTNFGTHRRPLIKVQDTVAKSRNLDECVAAMPRVLKAVNAVQATPWRINTKILEVLREVHRLGGDMAGIPEIDFEKTLPVKPWTNEEEFKEFKEMRVEEYRAWCYQQKMAHAFWVRNTGKREALHYKIFFGERYKSYENLYFPHYLDWRGRMYPYVAFVSPQGDDSGKALLEFAEALPIGDDGAYWMKIHIANCAGVDKVSFSERIRWVEDNSKLILDCAKDPFGERAWMDMDSPFKFLAASMEYAGLHSEGASFLSRLPVGMDGSCNGLQHYSALLRDDIGGRAVNLVPGETPGDIYQEVAKAVIPLVVADAQAGDETAQLWLGKIDRSIVKRNVMTLVYGVTAFGMAEQLLAEIQKRSTTSLSFLGSDNRDMPAAVYLARKVNEAISKVAVAAKEGMEWLQESARLVSEEGKSLSWTAPSGFQVVQEYQKMALKRVITCFGSCKKAQFTINTPTGELDKRGQKNGIAPNFVHSLDASHLVGTVLSCLDSGITSFGMVHDSYAVHPGNVSKMNTILRDEFIKMYESYDLEVFKEEIERTTGVELPPCPSKGHLELSLVRDSSYFFA